MKSEEHNKLLKTLRDRFEGNMLRHKGLDWPKIQERLDARVEKLKILSEMEKSGGEPDVVGHDKKTGEYIFCDCSAETPKDRRRVCYDKEGLNSRKEHKPDNNAVDMASEIGAEILTEDEYRDLQKYGNFDTKTSSWLKTPVEIRKLGGAIFGDYRYGNVFIYHNGAQSYFSDRGFRCSLRV